MLSSPLIYLLPRGVNSPVWGAGSAPFVTWLSLVSYREVALARAHGVFPALQWVNLGSSSGLVPAGLACLLGFVAPAVLAWWLWNYSLKNFDRLVGRPRRSTMVVPKKPLVASAAAFDCPPLATARLG